jgi:hypothetical protein
LGGFVWPSAAGGEHARTESQVVVFRFRCRAPDGSDPSKCSGHARQDRPGIQSGSLENLRRSTRARQCAGALPHPSVNGTSGAGPPASTFQRQSYDGNPDRPGPWQQSPPPSPADPCANSRSSVDRPQLGRRRRRSSMRRPIDDPAAFAIHGPHAVVTRWSSARTNSSTARGCRRCARRRTLALARGLAEPPRGAAV